MTLKVLILSLILFKLFAAAEQFSISEGNAFTMLPKGSPETSVIEQEFLSLLGLKSRPKLNMAQFRHNSAPHFLRQIYDSVNQISLERARDILQGEENSEKMLEALSNADFIISFTNQGLQMSKSFGDKEKQDSQNHFSHEFFYFSLSDLSSQISAEQKPILAELRLYKALSPVFPLEGDHFKLTLYKVAPVDDEHLGLVKVSEKAVHAYFFGWITFDLTQLLTEWQKDPLLNFGLQIAISDFNDTTDYSFPSVAISGSKADDFKQPFLVAFYPTFDETKTREKFYRSRRSVKPSYHTAMTNNDPYHKAKTRCQRKTLFVSFSDLGWDDWILAPESYHAYHCSGLCQFPLDANLNATNHAILQTLMSVYEPDSVPPACCAPKMLSPISVLYFDDDSNVILKRYREMVVEYCGCQ